LDLNNAAVSSAMATEESRTKPQVEKTAKLGMLKHLINMETAHTSYHSPSANNLVNAENQVKQKCHQPGTLLVKMESSAIKVHAKM
jgi:hypothetical protein